MKKIITSYDYHYLNIYAKYLLLLSRWHTIQNGYLEVKVDLFVLLIDLILKISHFIKEKFKFCSNIATFYKLFSFILLCQMTQVSSNLANYWNDKYLLRVGGSYKGLSRKLERNRKESLMSLVNSFTQNSYRVNWLRKSKI